MVTKTCLYHEKAKGKKERKNVGPFQRFKAHVTPAEPGFGSTLSINFWMDILPHISKPLLGGFLRKPSLLHIQQVLTSIFLMVE
jgi:hypothetical protein